MTETKRKVADETEGSASSATSAEETHDNQQSREDLMAQAVLAQFLATGKVRKGWVIRQRRAERARRRKAA